MKLKTRMLMSLSAAVMAALGVIASFLPQETLAAARIQDRELAVVLVQIVGALYLGFAFLNWTSRGILIGGIYGRPIALANFTHFAIVAITLFKYLLKGTSSLIVLFVVCVTFALWFGLVLFTHPGDGGSDRS